jgi:hypothetical protein
VIASALALVATLGGCTADDGEAVPTGAATTPGTATSSPATPAAPSAEAPATTPATTEVVPNAPCDPADGHPDCTDATGNEGDSFRYVVGYADCLEALGADQAYGLCTDLDGDGYAGYPDE